MKIADLPITENLMETEAPENPPIPEIYNPPENIVDMKENNETVAMKRLQDETERNNVGGKWRKREGIKRNLRNLPRTSYEECENNCDEMDRLKRYKSGINYILSALHCDVTEPPDVIDQQPMSESAVLDRTIPGIQNASAVRVKQPLREARQRPIIVLAVSDGTVPDIQSLSAVTGQAGALVRGSENVARLYSDDRYSTAQTDGAERTNESTANGLTDGIQGVENIQGAGSRAQYTRDRRKGNYNPTGYIWKFIQRL